MKQIVALVAFLCVSMVGCSTDTPTVRLSDGGMDAELAALPGLVPDFGNITVLSLTLEDEAVIQVECDNQFVGGCGSLYHDDVVDCVADVIGWVESLPAPCQSTAIDFLDCENEDPCWIENDPSVCDPERSVFLSCLSDNQDAGI